MTPFLFFKVISKEAALLKGKNSVQREAIMLRQTVTKATAILSTTTTFPLKLPKRINNRHFASPGSSVGRALDLFLEGCRFQTRIRRSRWDEFYISSSCAPSLYYRKRHQTEVHSHSPNGAKLNTFLWDRTLPKWLMFLSICMCGKKIILVKCQICH